MNERASQGPGGGRLPETDVEYGVLGATPGDSDVAAARARVRAYKRRLPVRGPMLAALLSVLAGATLHPVAQLAAQTSTRSTPSPAEFHGYALGTRYTITSAHYDYYRALAETSDRVLYREYGTSIQGRGLPMVIVGSRENLARLEEIRRDTRRIAAADEPLSPDELEGLIGETPAIVWIMIVDTDEEAGVEVLQEVAYELATGEDEETRSLRDRIVTIITPLTNPDSHARYVTWHMIYDVSGASTDPLAIENRAHWAMNTDGNAWGVDVNRDFGWFVTPEMGALANTMMAWRPQFLLDIHSGPTVIFLPPFPRPYHPLWPAQAPAWWEAVAERASDHFGRRGWSFKSRIDYEGVVGVGFGLSWAMLGPTVASFLYETFGGRPGMTTAFRRSDGTIATMRMAMDRHKLGIVSALEVARDRHDQLLRDAHTRVVQGMEEARNGEVRAVVIPATGEGTDPHKVERLLQRLTLQEVTVARSREAFRAEVRDFFSLEESESRSFPAGTYVVDLVQPNARLARALLDPTVDFSDPQVEAPYRRRMPYYDAPWQNLPFLFGVPAFAMSGSPPGAEPLATVPEAMATVPEPTAAGREMERAEPPYAWVWPSGKEASYRLAVDLMGEGFRVRVFHSAFRMNGEDFAKGTFAALRTRNPETLGERIRALAQERGARLVPVPGPFTEGGLTFGDDANLAAIPRPMVAVLADWPVNHDHTYGGIRSTLEGDFGLPFSPVMLQTINNADLSGYTAVVLPHAGMDVRGGPTFTRGYRGVLSMENLRRYVRGGGTLVAVQGAGEVIAGDSVLGRDVNAEGWAEMTEGTARGEWMRTAPPEAPIVSWRPGLEETGLPLLAAGYERPEFAAPASFPVLFSVPEEGMARVIARYGGDPDRLALDGFIPPGDREKIAGRPFVIVQPVGAGRVVYFAEDPTFRGAWYGMNLLFLNALLLGPTL